MFWALPMASRLGKKQQKLILKPAKPPILKGFNSFRKNVILLFLVFLVIRSTDLP